MPHCRVQRFMWIQQGIIFFPPILLHTYVDLYNYNLDIYYIIDFCNTSLHGHRYLKITIARFCHMRVDYALFVESIYIFLYVKI